jgi:diguanylate cyclase (GGDEF)-like protein
MLSAAEGRPSSFLLVEDDPFVLRALARQLRGLYPAAIIHEASGVEPAVEQISSGAIDVCIVDLFLGRESGIDLIERFRATAVSTAFVILTSSSVRELAARALQAGAIDYLVKGMFTDFELDKSVSFAVHHRRRQLAAQKAAMSDPLTGMANRVLFWDRLRTAFHRSQRDGGRVALMYVDIDGFKPVNDRYGHALGDLLLQAIAERLGHGLRAVDTVARLGGDEFGVLLEKAGHPEDVRRVAEKLRGRLCQPYQLTGTLLSIGASIGIASAPIDAADPESLMEVADQRMYAAKRRGGGVVDGEAG